MRYRVVNLYLNHQWVKLRSFVSLLQGLHQIKCIKHECVAIYVYQDKIEILKIIGEEIKSHYLTYD